MINPQDHRRNTSSIRIPRGLTPKILLSSNPVISLTKKTKKCQSAAGDRPDLIQTAPVPSRGLARPKIKINGTKKLKIKKQQITIAPETSHSLKNQTPLTKKYKSVRLLLGTGRI